MGPGPVFLTFTTLTTVPLTLAGINNINPPFPLLGLEPALTTLTLSLRSWEASLRRGFPSLLRSWEASLRRGFSSSPKVLGGPLCAVYTRLYTPGRHAGYVTLLRMSRFLGSREPRNKPFRHPFHCWRAPQLPYYSPVSLLADRPVSLLFTRFTVGGQVGHAGKRASRACWEESLSGMLGEIYPPWYTVLPTQEVPSSRIYASLPSLLLVYTPVLPPC